MTLGELKALLGDQCDDFEVNIEVTDRTNGAAMVIMNRQEKKIVLSDFVGTAEVADGWEILG